VLTSVAAAIGLLCAAVALVRLRRLARALETLTQSYWELRYEHTKLRSRVAQLDPDDDAGGEADAAPPAATPSVSFVPLSAIRRKDR
jgi:hypothetical protein